MSIVFNVSFEVALEKRGNVVNDGFQVAFGLLELPGLLIQGSLIVKGRYDKVPFYGFAAAGSILENFFSFCQVNQSMGELLLLNMEAAEMVELFEFLVEFFIIVCQFEQLLVVEAN